MLLRISVCLEGPILTFSPSCKPHFWLGPLGCDLRQVSRIIIHTYRNRRCLVHPIVAKRRVRASWQQHKINDVIMTSHNDGPITWSVLIAHCVSSEERPWWKSVHAEWTMVNPGVTTGRMHDRNGEDVTTYRCRRIWFHCRIWRPVCADRMFPVWRHGWVWQPSHSDR